MNVFQNPLPKRMPPDGSEFSRQHDLEFTALTGEVKPPEVPMGIISHVG